MEECRDEQVRFVPHRCRNGTFEPYLERLLPEGFTVVRIEGRHRACMPDN